MKPGPKPLDACKRGHLKSKYGYYDQKGIYKGCKICRSEANKKWFERKYKNDPEWQIRKHLRLNWDMTIAEYDLLLESQDNRCAICGTTDFGNTRGHIDHDHSTGKIRGILCSNCNNGLGRFKDNIEHLKNAIIYLKKDR
jgi:hypothetical protein